MNSSEKDFQTKLDEIGKLYEDGKDALYSVVDFGNPSNSKNSRKVSDCLRGLRDIAAMAVKAAYQIKEN